MNQDDIELLKRQKWIGKGNNVWHTPKRWDFRAEYRFEDAVKIAREVERMRGKKD
jgi:hypothetical protein